MIIIKNLVPLIKFKKKLIQIMKMDKIQIFIKKQAQNFINSSRINNFLAFLFIVIMLKFKNKACLINFKNLKKFNISTKV